MSTEATVRSAIVGYIQGIAVSTLGFDTANGNVQNYPIELEQPEARAEYLMADVNGERTSRAWAVHVLRTEQPGSDLGTRIAVYDIEVIGYYYWAKGIATTMIDHARAIRSQIQANRKLGGIVDFITDSSLPTFSEVTAERVDNVFSINFVYNAEHQAVTF